ncbi:Rhotekin [Chelonia mydas]|uniref:Rhotekin n=1 Tax=Chelonia mydas TaxID=8469 RepID=M7AVX7_CHEMY|nr:Rhotekin [Chelonia mydas]
MDDRLPCRGKVCVSDLRIPLMWKDTEYFKNKGDLHRCAVFCLLQLGVEIYDTEMVLVDRTLTDICFENGVLFTEAGPDFELKVELYSVGLEEDSALGSTPKKLASKLSSSLGRSSGKRLRAALDGAPGSPVSNGGSSPLLLPAPSVVGPKYHLLAHTALSLAEVQDSFRTHDLAITSNEESSFWLPLYGSMCCRLAAQPNCMAQQMMCGFLKLQVTQWKHCCDELMKIEVPSPRKPPALLAKQGSLYHEMAIEPVDDIEAVTDILARRVTALELRSDLGCPPWLSLFEGPLLSASHASITSDSASPSPGPARSRPAWGRPRTLSLDARLSTLKGRAGKGQAPALRPLSSSSSGGNTPESERQGRCPTRPNLEPRSCLQSQV